MRLGGGGRLMANAILNFHFDFLHPSLIIPVCNINIDKPACLSFSYSLDLLHDIDQTNINRDIRDGNWLSSPDPTSKWRFLALFWPNMLLRHYLCIIFWLHSSSPLFLDYHLYSSYPHQNTIVDWKRSTESIRNGKYQPCVRIFSICHRFSSENCFIRPFHQLRQWLFPQMCWRKSNKSSCSFLFQSVLLDRL